MLKIRIKKDTSDDWIEFNLKGEPFDNVSDDEIIESIELYHDYIKEQTNSISIIQNKN